MADSALGTGFMYPLAVAVLLLPAIAVNVRRLHGTGRPAWYLLIGLIPLIGSIMMLVWCCEDSERRDNEYGPWPKHGDYAVGSAAET